MELRGEEKFMVTVNHDLTLERMIEAAHLDWVDPFISSGHFPDERQGVERVRLEALGYGRVSEFLLFGDGYASLQELLALARECPRLQHRRPLVAPGSALRDPRGFLAAPCLYWLGSGRGLGLYWLREGWGMGI